MKILALDPGITTGYALLDEGGKLLESGNLDVSDLPDSILTVYAKDPEIAVVSELVPIPTMGTMNTSLLLAIQFVSVSFGDRLTYVRPGQWKTNPYIFNYPFPKTEFPNSTSHQRDAYRLGIYYVMFLQDGKRAQA